MDHVVDLLTKQAFDEEEVHSMLYISQLTKKKVHSMLLDYPPV